MYQNCIDIGLGLEQRTDKKVRACPARVAKAGQENIRTVHEPKPIQATVTLCMDKVAVLWSVPAAHKLRYVKEPVPSR
jgi:hypothetical protein